MAKTKISQFDATAANNTDLNSISIAEGTAPSNINNAIRELMSQLADLNLGNEVLSTLKIDNLHLDGNTIVTLDTNGDLNLTPNGTGSVVVAIVPVCRIANLHIANQRPVFVHDVRQGAGFLVAHVEGVIDQPHIGAIHGLHDVARLRHGLHRPIGNASGCHRLQQKLATVVTSCISNIGQVFNIGRNAPFPALTLGHRSGPDIDRVEVAMGDVVQRLISRATKFILFAGLSAEPPHACVPVRGDHAISELQPVFVENGFQLIFRQLIREVPFDGCAANLRDGRKPLPDRELKEQMIQVGREADHDA